LAARTVHNTLFEWQTDALADAAANAQLEGDDVGTFDSVTATVRLTNYAQIARKTIVLSNTEEVVNKAGRRSELAYQIAKRGAELKRDQEFVMLNGGVAVAGNTTTARVTASLGAFVKTNTDKQTNGVQTQATPPCQTVPALTATCALSPRRSSRTSSKRCGLLAALQRS
jgi:hypothetical protein